MAFDYEEYQSYTGLAKNLSRQKYGPLDVSQLFLSEDDLKWYCSNGVDSTLSVDANTTMWNNLTIYPYPGQVVALHDSVTKTVRILKLTEKLTTLSGGETAVVELSGKPQFEYSDIGIAPVGDGKSISVDADGKISIYGADSATENQQLVIKDGVVTWVTPDTADVDFLSSQISSNTELLTILTGDGVSSISEQIQREVAAIVDEAPEAFDTLKEIADWISNDNTSAVYLVDHVAQAEKDILALSGGLSDLTGDLSGISVGLTGDIAYISSTIYNDYAAKSYVNTISAALSTGVNSTINSVSSALNAQLTDITGNYATKTEVDAVSTLLSNEITALDSRIEKYEDVISIDNGIVQISALSVSTISGVNSDFVVSNVSAENVAIQSTSALTFTTEDKTLAEILNDQLTTITGNYATKTEVDAVSTLLLDEINGLDGRIEKYEDIISVDNGIVQISALSVSTISGVNSDFVVSNVSAENVSIQSTSALAFTTEGTTLAEILNELNADASAYVQLSTYNSQITALTNAITALNEHQEAYESAISIRDDGVVEISNLSVTNISSTNAEFTATSVYTDNLQIKDLSTVTIADRNNQTLEAILSALSAELSSAIITNDLTWQELP